MKNWKRDLLLLGTLLAVGVPLYVFSVFYFEIFHVMIEFIAVLVGVLIFTVSALSRKFVKATFLTQLGPGFLAAAIVTLLHELTSKGISLVPGYDANLPTQLWTIQSVLLAVSIFVSILSRRAKDGHWWRMGAYLGLASVAVFVAFSGVLPDFVAVRSNDQAVGLGLTAFGLSFEYLIVVLYLCAIALLRLWKRGSDDTMRESMYVTIVLFILAEVFFTFTNDPNGIFGFSSHFLRLFGFVMLYRSVVVEGIQKPYRTIFNELNDLSQTDGLTGLYNHRHFMESLGRACEKARRDGTSLYLLVFDIDRFKSINDTYGHTIGDKVLQEIAVLVKEHVRANDIVCRQGGDEFAVLLSDVPKEFTEPIVDRFRKAFLLATLTEEGIRLTVSGGLVAYAGEDPIDLVTRADRLLYSAKNDGRNRIYIATDEGTPSLPEK
jgi:diguanylate cyclase (GGDEF)-like protein